jgi:hypothetical protein
MGVFSRLRLFGVQVHCMDYGANGGEEMACGRACPVQLLKGGWDGPTRPFLGYTMSRALTFPAAELVMDQLGCYMMSAVKGLGRKQR